MKKVIDLHQSGNSRPPWSMPNLAFWIRVILFSLFWVLLTGWQPGSWAIGAGFIFMASSLSLYLTARQRLTEKWLINPTKFLSFLYYFFVQSLRGGWDIAKLALIPKSTLSSGMISYHTDLVTGSQIFTFMQVLSLLPGTVCAKHRGCEITIHVLNLNSFNRTEIDDCQVRVSELLGTRAQLLGEKGDL